MDCDPITTGIKNTLLSTTDGKTFLVIFYFDKHKDIRFFA